MERQMKTIKQYQLEAAVINDALSFSDEIIKSMENFRFGSAVVG